MGTLNVAGSWVAIITPFRDGAVDFGALEQLIDWHVESGTDAIVSCGTTGESPTLSHAEHDQVIARTIQRAAGRVPVIAGTGSNATTEAVRLTKAAAAAGASASLQVSPYYNKPGQEGLYRHFATIAEAAPDLPLILYNVPGRCGVTIAPPTVARLTQIANVAGIKEAAGSVAAVSDMLDAAPDLRVLSGDDALTLPMMSVGAVGVISVAANVVPAEMRALVAAAAAGEMDVARAAHRRLWPLFRATFAESNPIPIKAAVAMLGRCTPEIRLPLTPASEASSALLDGCLRALGVLS